MRNLVPAAVRLGLITAGATLGPAAFLGAGFVTTFAAAVFKKELFSESLAETAANVLANLSTDLAKGLFQAVRNDPNRNYDIERAMAAAIRKSLQDIHREYPGHDHYFRAWLLHLAKPDEARLNALFAAGNANNTILLAERPELWWPHLEATLCRWYVEQRQVFDSMNLSLPSLPRELSDLLARELPTRADHAFIDALKNDERARYGFEQRFLRHLAAKVGRWGGGWSLARSDGRDRRGEGGCHGVAGRIQAVR